MTYSDFKKDASVAFIEFEIEIPNFIIDPKYGLVTKLSNINKILIFDYIKGEYEGLAKRILQPEGKVKIDIEFRKALMKAIDNKIKEEGIIDLENSETKFTFKSKLYIKGNEET